MRIVRLNVLSLFDGMSCGQIALERAGLAVDRYYASEIDRAAIDVCLNNYPNTIQLGDVTHWHDWQIDWSSIDLVLAGSPCQGFSFSGAQLAFNDPRSALFFQFADVLSHISRFNPRVSFILENVKMKRENLDIISLILGVEPPYVNSDLVSAQSRPRYYWSNIVFNAPKNVGMMFSDIIQDIDSVPPWTWVSPTQLDRINADHRTIEGPVQMCTQHPLLPARDKARCLLARDYKGVGNRQYSNGVMQDGILRVLSINELEMLQTVPVGYTRTASRTQSYKMLGNGWTVDVIAHILSHMKESN